MSWMRDKFETKLSLEWFFDKAWPIFWVAFGGTATVAFGKATEWIDKQGLIIYPALFFTGGYLMLAAYYLILKTERISIINNRVKKTLETSSANPVAKRYKTETIKLSEFYDPFYTPHSKKIFDECTITGPGNIFLNGGTLQHCGFNHCQIVIMDKLDLELYNVTGFHECTFNECLLVNCTIFVIKEQYKNLNPLIREHIQVVSGAI